MEFGVFGWMILSVVLVTGGATADPQQYSRAQGWLSRYGYLPPPDHRTSRLQTKEALEEAIRVMQRYGGIRETGQLDGDTLRLMETPRCALPDIMGGEDLLRKRRRRKRRYALTGLQWDRKDLTWSVLNYPSPVQSPSLTPSTVDQLLFHAFKAWSDAAPLSFRRLLDGAGARDGAVGKLRVSFTRSMHEDGYPFDGQGGTLAHAFFPGRAEIAGDTHFDDDEAWSYGGLDGTTDLFTVAVHEFGHALGLSHSSSDPSIMRPYYQGPVEDMGRFRLPLDDRLAVQQLYGVKDQTSPPGGDPDPPRLPPPPPSNPRPTEGSDPAPLDRCSGNFDAIANIRGEVFFFKGAHFWRTQRDGSLVSLRPALISNFWMGLPPDMQKVDAVYERKSDNCIVFFIGSQYWLFRDTQAMGGFPRPLSDWGLATRDRNPVELVEAAFVWAHNGHTYLFSGGRFWRFDESRSGAGVRTLRPDPGYPRDAALWKGAPSQPDDIITWGKGDAYFFKDALYWVLRSGGMDQDEGQDRDQDRNRDRDRNQDWGHVRGHVRGQSIGVDWLQCLVPPTAVPPPSGPRDRDCSCPLNVATTHTTPTPGNWLLLLFTLVWATYGFASK